MLNTGAPLKTMLKPLLGAVLLSQVFLAPLMVWATTDVDVMLAEVDSSLKEQEQLMTELQANVSVKRQFETEMQGLSDEVKKLDIELKAYTQACNGRQLAEPEYTNCLNRYNAYEKWRIDYDSRRTTLIDKDVKRAAEGKKLGERYTYLSDRVKTLQVNLQAAEFAKYDLSCTGLTPTKAHQCLQNLWNSTQKTTQSNH